MCKIRLVFRCIFSTMKCPFNTFRTQVTQWRVRSRPQTASVTNQRLPARLTMLPVRRPLTQLPHNVSRYTYFVFNLVKYFWNMSNIHMSKNTIFVMWQKNLYDFQDKLSRWKKIISIRCSVFTRKMDKQTHYRIFNINWILKKNWLGIHVAFYFLQLNKY